MTQIIQLQHVSHAYDAAHPVLHDVNFALAEGEMAFITGPSGAGKSTLLKLIALLDRPSRGQIVVDGQYLSKLSRRRAGSFRQNIGVVFQNFNLLNDRSVFDNVAMPLLIRGMTDHDLGRRVRAALDAVGLLGREQSLPLTLSGGEQQRVGIARAIVAKPKLILADEPTGNLDPAMAQEIMNLFRRFNEVGVSVLIASHAQGLIARMGCRVLRLEGGHLQDATNLGAEA